ncbi:MAG: hypothetical protein J5585_04695 [Clostridia bacterium]|nr:hypothetical protein [Clostridia bacterium]
MDNKKRKSGLSALWEKIAGRILRYAFHKRAISKVLAALKLITLPKENEKIKSVLSTLSSFNDHSSIPTGKAYRKLAFDLFFARIYYAAEYKEYFLYGLDKADDPNKLDYVCWHELKDYFKKLNELGNPEIYRTKEKTYEVYRDFFRRELLYIFSEKQKDEFISFFQTHSSWIIKPTDCYGGKGVKIFHLADGITPDQIWEEVSVKMPFVLEELIEQAPEMSAFYPHAVNTIRYNTFYNDGKLTRIQAVFRIGRGGSNVDNATSGGIYTLVDTETGRILCPARSFRNELFEDHPDTGVHFEGSFIPRWDELNELLEKIVCVVPEQKQLGWDFALSKNGWVMVEGNTMPAIQSFDLYHGVRKILRESFGTVVPMWDRNTVLRKDADK